MTWAAGLAWLAACGGAGPSRAPGSVAARLAGASAPELARMLHAPLGYGGLRFADLDCNQQFAAPGTIGADRLDAFARCLAALPLVESNRASDFPDEVVLAYAPGFEVEVLLDADDSNVIRWIGFAGRHDLADALPSVAPAALEPQAAGSASVALDDAARTRLSRERAELGIPGSYAWMKVCIDGTGAVTGAHPREESSPIAGEVFSAVAMSWRFRPFVADGHPIPVCALRLISDPPDYYKDSRLPYPIPAELGSVRVSPSALHRTAGQIQIPPDDGEKVALAELGLHRLVAVFAYCIDDHGAVTAVQPLRSSRLERYDARLTQAIAAWTFAPFVVEGAPTPACASVSFIYQQR